MTMLESVAVEPAVPNDVQLALDSVLERLDQLRAAQPSGEELETALFAIAW